MLLYGYDILRAETGEMEEVRGGSEERAEGCWGVRALGAMRAWGGEGVGA